MNEANNEIDVLTHCVMLSYGVMQTEKQQRQKYVMHLLLAKSNANKTSVKMHSRLKKHAIKCVDNALALAKSNSVFSAHLIDTNAKAFHAELGRLKAIAERIERGE